MSVVGFAKELSESRSGGEQDGGALELVRRFAVTTDNPKDGPLTVLTAPLLPAYGDFYFAGTEQSTLVRAISRTATQATNSRLLWYVDVTYSSDYDETTLGTSTTPLAELPSISLSFEIDKEPIVGEYDSNSEGNEAFNKYWKSGILNGAGQAYENPFPEREVARPVVTFTRNEANVSMAVASAFVNSVNSTTWSGLAPRQAKLRGITARSNVATVNNADFAFYEVTYEFAIKRETWDLQLLDYGNWYLKYADGSTAGSRYMFDPANPDVTGLLDSRDTLKPGQKLARNQDAQYRRFRIHSEKDFGQLGIYLNLSLDQQKKPRRR